MAKTLVGLYDTFTDAERIVLDLVSNDFSRGDISLITHDTNGRQADYTYSREELLTEDGGLIDQLTDLGVPVDEARSYAEGLSRRGALVVVNASDDQADRGLEIMQPVSPAHSSARPAQGQEAGRARVAPYTMTQATANVRRGQARHGGRVADQEGTTIPVVEEELSVGKRQVEHGTTRIHTRVEERPVEETVRLREERVVVERHPVNRPATEADLRASEAETIEITETVEEPVISKQARVVEEVTVRKEAREHTETVRDMVRRKDVDVKPAGTSQVTDTRGFATYAADFRRHHTTMFASSGLAYADYEPAYRYGYNLGTNERYRGRDWAALETEARRDWEARQPGTWERFKDAIRYGWENITGNGAERSSSSRTMDRRDFATYSDDFRKHYVSAFGDRGAAYTDYEPAYRYGYELGTNERYRGRDWAAFEADARRDWEARHPSSWERFKDAIRYGWDKVRART
jgi:uncharacterized protein (TIGR02271 family)